MEEKLKVIVEYMNEEYDPLLDEHYQFIEYLWPACKKVSDEIEMILPIDYKEWVSKDNILRQYQVALQNAAGLFKETVLIPKCYKAIGALQQYKQQQI